VVRSLALLTILFLTNSFFYNSGWLCIPAPGDCSVTTSTDCCPSSAPPEISQSCVSPCNPESQSTETADPCASSCGRRCDAQDVADCGATANAECIAKIAGTLEPECQSTAPTGKPDFSPTCNIPDNTRCDRKVDSPRDCKPMRCFLIYPMLAAEPPKAPASIDAPVLRLLDLQLWVERPQANPILSPPRATDPIIETTVLRI